MVLQDGQADQGQHGRDLALQEGDRPARAVGDETQGALMVGRIVGATGHHLVEHDQVVADHHVLLGLVPGLAVDRRVAHAATMPDAGAQRQDWVALLFGGLRTDRPEHARSPP